MLVDFGLAGRQIRPGCATGCYGAPEIWGLVPDNATPRPAAADVYAFACVAYEMFTGDTLFDGAGELAIINSHLSHDGYPEKRLALRRSAKLAAVCDLIANGLRQHPDERISIDEMREGFRELGTGLRQLSWPLGVEAAAQHGTPHATDVVLGGGTLRVWPPLRVVRDSGLHHSPVLLAGRRQGGRCPAHAK